MSETMEAPATDQPTGPLNENDVAAFWETQLAPQVEVDDGDQEVRKPEPQLEGADAPAEPAKAAEEAPPVYKVKVNGEEIDVPLPELLNGYQRTADYTQKTMALAEQAKEAQALRDQYKTQLDQVTALMKRDLDQFEQVDWGKLIESDPVKYLQLKHLQEQRQAEFAKYESEQKQISIRMQQETNEQAAARFQAEQQALLAKLPDWKDEAKRTAEQTSLRKFLQSEGFRPEEIDAATDHRAIVMARKAMLFDQLIAQQKNATAKVQKAPPKVERPGVAPSSPDGRTAAMQRLKRTGSVEDAARVFESLLG